MQGQGVPCVGCTDLLHERGALHTWRARVHPATARTRNPFVCVKEDTFLSEKRDASLAVAVRPGAPPPPIDHTGPKQKLASEISLQRARASFSAPDAAERDVYAGRTRASAVWRRIRWPELPGVRVPATLFALVGSARRTTASACS
jgi:hypothetical protein